MQIKTKTAQSTKIAVFGGKCSFTDIAAKKYFSGNSNELEYFMTTDKAIRAVKRNKCKYGVIPYKNNNVGNVETTKDFNSKNHLKVIESIELPIHHNLLSLKKIPLNNIKKVVSHPHALLQCKQYLINNLPQAKLSTAKSTSDAARLLAKGKLGNDTAVIASNEAAKMHELVTVDAEIEDTKDNKTTFLVISAAD